MKKIGIIGAGISGLYIANLFKKNPKYQVSIFDKKNSLNIDEGYGVQSVSYTHLRAHET